MPVIRHKSVEYVGMFEYKKEDEELLIRSLIFGEYVAGGTDVGGGGRRLDDAFSNGEGKICYGAS